MLKGLSRGSCVKGLDFRRKRDQANKIIYKAIIVNGIHDTFTRRMNRGISLTEECTFSAAAEFNILYSCFSYLEIIYRQNTII